MAYKALYLKYRPQTFEEVAGQTAPVRTLKNALATGKMAHAYLFTGPRGTGKTSMARLFAKALDCEEGVGHQCNHCSNCLAISDGSHPDVIEIDAASNNGVEQVRDLIEKVRYSPIKGRYKIYIIDEVHMMTQGAFNALLKTLEEPPENVIFILCTTEPFKILPTILSRCQRFDFSRVSPEDMSKKLVEILHKEGAEFDQDGVNAVVSLADGGMRDSLSILDQVLAYSNNKLFEDDVLTLFGLASIEEKVAMLESLERGDTLGVVTKSEEMLSTGIDVRRLVSDLIGLLKDLLIYERTKEPSLMSALKEDQAIYLSEIINPIRCNEMLSTLIDAQNDFKNVNDVRSLFQLTLLRLSSFSAVEGEKSPAKPLHILKEAPVRQEVKPQPAPVVEEPKPVIEEPKPIIKEEPAPVVEETKPTESAKEEKVVEETSPVLEEKVEEVKPEPVKEEVSPLDAPPSYLFESESEPKEEPVEETHEVEETPDEEAPIEEEAPVDDSYYEEARAVAEEEKKEAEPAPIPTPAPAPKSTPLGANKFAAPAYNPEPEEKPKVDELQPKTQKIFHLALEGEEYELSDEEIVKAYVISSPKERNALRQQWPELEKYKNNATYGEFVQLLQGGNPFILAEEILVISYNFNRNKTQNNIVENQQYLSKIISKFLKRKVFVYGINPTDRSRIINTVNNLIQVDKLPKKENVILFLPKK
ncbi:MAG: DNA polymerase III subunit gamma/tau [Bacilli bacterium]|nr:DNA polymerase III subunit gamma/tau [Bacilli bacterium]